MKRLAVVVILLLRLGWLYAEEPDFRLFGSVGNESHLTPGAGGQYTFPVGGAGTEFGDLQVSRVSDFGLRYYF